MPLDLFGVLCAACGMGILCLALLFGRTPFWLYLGAVLLAGGFLIVAFS